MSWTPSGTPDLSGRTAVVRGQLNLKKGLRPA